MSKMVARSVLTSNPKWSEVGGGVSVEVFAK
jgi:hypothetical protein